MTVKEVLKELESYGNESTKRVFINHGAKEPFFGVKVQDLKKILKKTKKDHDLAIELYNTGNSDAMYLAGLMADEKKITKEELKDWAEKASWHMISECTVAWLAAETDHAEELAFDWIDSGEDKIAATGWSTLSSYISIAPPEDIDVEKYRGLLDRVEKNISEAGNRVKYTMNNFVIAVGSYIPELTDEAAAAGARIGKVEVYMGKTSCKVPDATQYIRKVKDKGRIGKKRKQARC